jgi:hypothetical protein
LGRADRGPAPDIGFVQTSRPTVRITSGTYGFDIAIVAFRQEPAWTGVDRIRVAHATRHLVEMQRRLTSGTLLLHSDGLPEPPQ